MIPRAFQFEASPMIGNGFSSVGSEHLPFRRCQRMRDGIPLSQMAVEALH